MPCWVRPSLRKMPASRCLDNLLQSLLVVWQQCHIISIFYESDVMVKKSYAIPTTIILSLITGIGAYSFQWKQQKDDFDKQCEIWHSERNVIFSGITQRLDSIDSSLKDLNTYLLMHPRLAIGDSP